MQKIFKKDSEMKKEEEEKEESFGSYIKSLRLKKNMSLREYCQKTGSDPGNHSKLERSLIFPPRNPEKLIDLARSLGVKSKKEWLYFFKKAKDESIESIIRNIQKAADEINYRFRQIIETETHGFFLESPCGDSLHDTANSTAENAAAEFAYSLFRDHGIKKPRVFLTDLSTKEKTLYHFHVSINIYLIIKEEIAE